MSTFKRMGFLSFYILPFLTIAGLYLGGFYSFSAFGFAYLIIPILDEIVGKDSENIPEVFRFDLSKDPYFIGILHTLAYVQVLLVLWALYVVAFLPLSGLEYAGLLLSVMTVSSGGINIAHELGHKKEALSRFHSQLILMTVCYMHFYIEHNQGHHVHVATPQDPATSKEGQHLYGFWSQSVIGGFKSAWRIETRRLQRANQNLRSLRHNRMLQYILYPLVFCLSVTLVFSLMQGYLVWQVPLFFFAQSFLAFSSLEAVNYIEHYGMQRREIRPGKYERVNPLHSWNANHLVSNFFLFQLQRHSDHHAYAARPYQVLRHFEESPQLPAGYPVMILTSLVPPLWFKVMNPRLQAWRNQQLPSEEDLI